MSKNKKKNNIKFTSLQLHKREKSKLITPLHTLGVKPLNWIDDFLPEHIWIEYLFKKYPESYIDLYNVFLDTLEKYCPEKTILYGYISDFSAVPTEKRDAFIKENEELIYKAFSKPLGRIIAFYPEAPCSWLLNKKHLDEGGPLDYKVELEKLSECVLRLMSSKDLHTGHVRAIPLSREFKHNRLFIVKGVADDVVDMIPRYPTYCTDEEKYRVQQFARQCMNLRFEHSKIYKNSIWPKYLRKLFDNNGRIY